MKNESKSYINDKGEMIKTNKIESNEIHSELTSFIVSILAKSQSDYLSCDNTFTREKIIEDAKRDVECIAELFNTIQVEEKINCSIWYRFKALLKSKRHA